MIAWESDTLSPRQRDQFRRRVVEFDTAPSTTHFEELTATGIRLDRRGKHKARVFATVLGFASDNADELRSALLTAAATVDAQPTFSDRYERGLPAPASQTCQGR